jgi:hypothetical protein
VTEAIVRKARTPESHRLVSPSRVAWSLALLAVLTGLVASGAVAQLASPFIRRDDWPYLMPPDTPGAADPLTKVREEGRWLNYLWWQVVGQHGTPVTAMLTYAAAYVLFVLGLWRLFRVRGRAAGFLLALALLVSPLWVRLFYWPGTLSASVVVAAAGVWTLPWAAQRRPRLAAWVLAFTILAVLSYPPVAGVLLLCALVRLRNRPWRDVLLVTAWFLACYLVAVGLVILIGWAAFGQVGPEIAAWRGPNPLRSLHDLRVNVGRYVRRSLTLVGQLGVASVVGAVACVACAVDRRVRPVWGRIMVAVAVATGLEAVQTVTTGVRVNPRASMWAWLSVVIVCGLLLAGHVWSRRLAHVLLAVLGVVGVLAWREDIGEHQATRREYEAIVDAAVAARVDDPGREIVFYQADRAAGGAAITLGTVRMMLYEAGGVVPRWCRPAECAEIAARAPGEGPVLDLGSVTGVLVPQKPDWL